MSDRGARPRGGALVETVALTVVVALAGVGGFRALGTAFGTDIADEGGGVPSSRVLALPSPQARLSAQAGLGAVAGVVRRLSGKVGGLASEAEELWHVVESRFGNERIAEELSPDAVINGVLIVGEPGTGKTALARAVAEEANVPFETINGLEILSGTQGESGEALAATFKKLEDEGGGILFIDEVDALVPHRDARADNVMTPGTQETGNNLLTLMDGLKQNKHAPVLVIGATNRADAIDGPFRRPGRFSKEIVIGTPDAAGRAEIFDIYARTSKIGKDVSFASLVEQTPGWTGSDIMGLFAEAALQGQIRLTRLIEGKGGPAVKVDQSHIDAFAEQLPKVVNWQEEGASGGKLVPVKGWEGDLSASGAQRYLKWLADNRVELGKEGLLNKKTFNPGERVTINEGALERWFESLGDDGRDDMVRNTLPELAEKTTSKAPEVERNITAADFAIALKKQVPNALREGRIKPRGVTLADIGGYEGQIEQMRASFEALRNPEAFARFGVDPEPEHILLSGPPQHGKKTLAEAVSNSVGANVVLLTPDNVRSMWFGESGQNFKRIFDKARASKPTVVLIDQIDVIGRMRGTGAAEGDNLLSSMISQIDGFGSEEGVSVIGITSRPDDLDSELAQLFRVKVAVDDPNAGDRGAILTAMLKNTPLDDKFNLDELVKGTEGWNVKALKTLTQRAIATTIREAPDSPTIAWDFFKRALAELGGSVDEGTTKTKVETPSSGRRGR